MDVTGFWAANQAALTTEAGITIENPQAIGTYVSHGTNLNLQRQNGAGNAWRAFKTENKWKVIY
jgi:hypothetical protein